VKFPDSRAQDCKKRTGFFAGTWFEGIHLKPKKFFIKLFSVQTKA
jgi:hypothetical protein